MQLSATTTAAKLLPVDLMPEALPTIILSIFSQSPPWRDCHLPGDDASRSQGDRKAFAKGMDDAEFKGCNSPQPWIIRAGLGG